jgi:DNA-binding beta-propeller fold protein YncE
VSIGEKRVQRRALSNRRRAVRRRRRAAALAVFIVAAAAAALTMRAGSAGQAEMQPRTSPHAQTARGGSALLLDTAPPGPLFDRPAGHLSAAVADPAAAVVGDRTILAGGLTAQDTSSADIISLQGTTSRVIGRLPAPQHDAAAVALGRFVYVFGGGDGVRQLDHILRIDPQSGRSVTTGRLPAASSDSAAATVGGIAYVVGGYTGTRWLDTIVAYRPGSASRIVAHLPSPLRYPAVTASGDAVVIAGGSRPDGSASRAVYAFHPGRRSLTLIGQLPAATTHAAAASLAGIAYIIGGRGATLGSARTAVIAVDPRTRRVERVGSLRMALSDLAAASVGGGITVVGGLQGRTATPSIGRLSGVRTRAARAPSATTRNVYAADEANMLTGAARRARALVYVPNSGSNTLDVIDQRTFKVIGHYAVGALPQHVTPSYDLRTLYVDNDRGNSLTPIDPVTGRPAAASIPVADPYNLYFTPDGRFAIVVSEALQRLDFRNAHTMALHHSLWVPCRGVDHMDFSADGKMLLASCEFSGQMIAVDVTRERVIRTMRLPWSAAMPQDVKLSPDGSEFYVADMIRGGVWLIDARTLRVARFIPTGAGAHGLYPSRDARHLYVSNRSAGTVSVLSFAHHRIVTTWRIPGGTPDMGGVSADGRTLWLSGRYRSEVYAIDTRTGKLRARIHVGSGPHGLAVWPQPGRYSLGHTGAMR